MVNKLDSYMMTVFLIKLSKNIFKTSEIILKKKHLDTKDVPDRTIMRYLYSYDFNHK